MASGDVYVQGDKEWYLPVRYNCLLDKAQSYLRKSQMGGISLIRLTCGHVCVAFSVVVFQEEISIDLEE